jgi:hypothetical protein
MRVELKHQYLDLSIARALIFGLLKIVLKHGLWFEVKELLDIMGIEYTESKNEEVSMRP